MFESADRIQFALDAHPRLWLGAPWDLFPLAAWLHTDVQGSYGNLIEFMPVMRDALAAKMPIVGNGWVVNPAIGGIELCPRYVRRAPSFVAYSTLWPVLQEMAAFLSRVGGELRVGHPAPAHDVMRMMIVEDDGSLRDHTYFPTALDQQAVADAAQEAWQGPEVLRDSVTGAWSGFSNGLEIAGYYDPDLGEVLSYFPVVSPLVGVAAAAA